MTGVLPATTWHYAHSAPSAGERSEIERRGRMRVAVAMAGFCLLFGTLSVRLVFLGIAAGAVTDDGPGPILTESQARPDIVDRNDEILATDIKTAALFAEPRYVIDPDEATEMLASVLPGLDRDRLRQLLSTDAKFAYIKREITPRQQEAIHKLGIPGIGFRVENRRFYPGGHAASHVLGTVNIDNQGIAGMEKYIDGAFLNDLQIGRLRRQSCPCSRSASRSTCASSTWCATSWSMACSATTRSRRSASCSTSIPAKCSA